MCLLDEMINDLDRLSNEDLSLLIQHVSQVRNERVVAERKETAKRAVTVLKEFYKYVSEIDMKVETEDGMVEATVNIYDIAYTIQGCYG